MRGVYHGTSLKIPNKLSNCVEPLLSVLFATQLIGLWPDVVAHGIISLIAVSGSFSPMANKLI